MNINTPLSQCCEQIISANMLWFNFYPQIQLFFFAFGYCNK